MDSVMVEYIFVYILYNRRAGADQRGFRGADGIPWRAFRGSRVTPWEFSPEEIYYVNIIN